MPLAAGLRRVERASAFIRRTSTRVLRYHCDAVRLFGFLMTPIMVDAKILAGRSERRVAEVIAQESQIHLLVRGKRQPA